MKIEKVESPYHPGSRDVYIKFTKNVGNVNSLEEVVQYLKKNWSAVAFQLMDAIWAIDLSDDAVEKNNFADDPGALELRALCMGYSYPGVEPGRQSWIAALVAVLKSITISEQQIQLVHQKVVSGKSPVATDWTVVRLEYFEIKDNVPNYSNERYADILVPLSALSSLSDNYANFKDKI